MLVGTYTFFTNRRANGNLTSAPRGTDHRRSLISIIAYTRLYMLTTYAFTLAFAGVTHLRAPRSALCVRGAACMSDFVPVDDSGWTVTETGLRYNGEQQ